MQLKHLANKIDEILGGASNGEGLQRNEKGQVRLRTCAHYVY